MKHILVIDDDRDVLRAVSAALDLFGYAVTGIRAPVTAYDLVCFPSPDLVLLDIMLHGPNSGIDLVAGFRAEYPTAKLAAFSASHIMMAAAIDAAVFDATVDKPVDIVVLSNVVQDLIGAGKEESHG